MERRNVLALVTVVLFLVMGVVQSAQATLLNLVLDPSPDILSSGLDIVYVAATDQFTATGFASTLDDDGIGSPEAISGSVFGSYLISATINSSGSLVGGTLTVGGTIPSLGYNSGTLLTGTLTGFGFPDPGGDPLEFTFDVTGGDAAGLYGGGSGGIILGFTSFAGSFASDFNNNFGFEGFGSGIGDTAPVVPEPLSLSLLLLGSGVLRRRKQLHP